MSDHPGTGGTEDGIRRVWASFVTAVGLITRAYPWGGLGAVLAAIVAGLAPVASALFLRDAVDVIAAGQPLTRALLPAAGLAAVGLVSVGTPYATAYLSGQLRRKLTVLTSDRLFRTVTGWPGLRRFEQPEYYDRLRLAQQSGESTPQNLVSSGMVGLQAVITMIGFLATMITISPAVAAFVVLAALPSVPVNLTLSRDHADSEWWNSPASRRVQFFSRLLTGVDAAKEIRLFGIGDFLRRRMLTDLAGINEVERRIESRGMWRNLALALLGALVAGGGILWTVRGTALGAYTLGDLTALVAALAGTQLALSTSVLQFSQLYQHLLTFGHYADVTALGSDLSEPAETTPAPALQHGIEFRDVWFRYDERLPWALRGVSLTIPAGQSTGLVGQNGSGKSTLVKLLCRFYDPQRGTILWDGVDLRDLDPDELRDRITAVFQDYVCYELTASENIAVGDLSALDHAERLTGAAESAGMASALEELPRGYATLLSRVMVNGADPASEEVGTLLSGGQWQRMAIARAAVRTDRDLMILDEPSAGLDARAEYEVAEQLRRQRTGRTSLLITHRLAAMRATDQIVVLAEGSVAERGSHETLVTTGGVYADLYALQASGYAADSAV